MLDELWAHMAARYGHTWTSQYVRGPDAAMAIAMAEWGETLRGLTAEQIQRGLDADMQRGDEWPPSSAHFRALCFGIPSFAAMRYEMTHAEVSRTPFGLLCWKFVDPFLMRQADQREAHRIARDAYELAKDHVLRGGELPEVHEALARPDVPERRTASPEVAKRHLDEILSNLDASAQDAREDA